MAGGPPLKLVFVSAIHTMGAPTFRVFCERWVAGSLSRDDPGKNQSVVHPGFQAYFPMPDKFAVCGLLSALSLTLN